ncbi:MAG: YfiH family protein [Psychrobacter glaciei]|jgi:YfiH family protein
MVASWPAPKRVKTLITTRNGGVSSTPFDSMNLGSHVDDNVDCVLENRKRLARLLPAEPKWLNQVHGVQVLDASVIGATIPDADGSFTRQKNNVCCVMSADCLPVLLCNQQGSQVAAVHAGWRGLLDGVIENAVAAFNSKDTLLAYLGPAIGPKAFEVGDEVKNAFCHHHEESNHAFERSVNKEKWLADIYSLARLRLSKLGVTGVYGGLDCTFEDSEHFFSYRRDGKTGRMASLIWIEGD